MENKEIIYFILTCIGIILSFVLGLWLAIYIAIATDLSEKITIIEQENTEIKQRNTELKWELDQVDQMICVNEEIK
jgi:hypothetical protein